MTDEPRTNTERQSPGPDPRPPLRQIGSALPVRSPDTVNAILHGDRHTLITFADGPGYLHIALEDLDDGTGADEANLDRDTVTDLRDELDAYLERSAGA